MNPAQEQVDVLLARAAAVDWCKTRGIMLRGSIAVATENQWRTALEFASASELEILAGYVRAAEIQQDRAHATDEAFDRARAAREQPLSAEEQAEANQLGIEAERAYLDAQLPATRQQLTELIDLTRDVLNVLTKRG